MKSQKDFIDECLKKYEYESLSQNECWEDAHYPEPECRNGTETVRLWSRDHAAHGVIQSEELNHPCLHSYRWHTDRNFIESYYIELLPLLIKWQTNLVKMASPKGVEKNKELNLGFFNPNYHSSKEGLENKSKAGKIGGTTTASRGGAQFIVDWTKDPKNKEKRKEICSLGGKASKGCTGKKKITNGVENKMISLDAEVPEGWRYGCPHHNPYPKNRKSRKSKL